MSDLRVASRYVKSLLDLAVEKNVLDRVHEDMRMFAELCQESRPFRLMLKSPVIKHERKRDILHKVFSGKVHELTMAIFDIITRKNREPLLPAIAKGFHSAYNHYKNIGEASVTTTMPLDADLRKEFERIVKQISEKKEIELIEKVDKDLIGGFVLNVGDKQIDASISSKLKQLKTEFTHNPYIKEF